MRANHLRLESVVDSPTSMLADGIRYLRGGSLDRARACFEQATSSRDPQIRSEALRRLADIKRRRAEWEDGLMLTRRARSVARRAGLREEEAAALNIEATIHLQKGDFEQAVALYREALELKPGARQRGLICQNLGTAYAQHGRLAEASEWYARSTAAFRVAGHRREAMLSLINQGNLQMDRGELAEAERIFRDGLAYMNEDPSPDTELQGLIEMNLAEALGRQGSELDHALDLVLSATGTFAASGNRPYLVACHRVLALISERRGEWETAISALEHGRDLAAEIGSGPEISRLEEELSRLQRERQQTPAQSTEAP